MQSYGDLFNQANFWGDFTHPTAMAEQKAANQIMIFIGKDPNRDTAWFAVRPALGTEVGSSNCGGRWWHTRCSKAAALIR